ncbi:hypothetical protein H8E88_21850 [candidate division KSB1 bacterium]|nr:hypothetical protein [candidate division KSB1 bacterium]
MKKLILPFLLLLLCSAANAQLPKIDVSFRKNMMTHKAKHYQQMLRCEQQKTANQDIYDVTYYSLDLTLDPATSHLTGIVEIAAKVTASTLNRIELNFWHGMTVTGIHFIETPGVQLNYENNNDILVVDLSREYVQGEQFRLIVKYNGRPQDSDYYSFAFDSYNGEPMIWTLSSVFGARLVALQRRAIG